MILGDIIEFLILSEELKSNWDRFYVIKKMRQQKYLVLKDKNYDACDQGEILYFFRILESAKKQQQRWD